MDFESHSVVGLCSDIRAHMSKLDVSLKHICISPIYL